MNINRLLRWLDRLCVTETMLKREHRRMQHLKKFSLQEEFSRAFPYQLGGITGPISYLCVQASVLEEKEKQRIVSIATEGASMLGLAYAFHPHKKEYMALLEGLIAKTLIGGDKLESLGSRVAMAFAMAPQASAISPLWFRQILATTEVVLQATNEDYDLPQTCLSIEPLFHQERRLGETLVLGDHPLPIEQHTAVEAVEEILSRHITAASKRLRADQLKELQIELPSFPAIGQLRERIAAMIMQYPAPIVFSQDWKDENRDALSQLSQRIEFIPQSKRWRQHWEHNYASLGKLYRTSVYRERLRWISQRHQFGTIGFMRLESRLGHSLAIEEHRFYYPVSVSLYTTRGGCWKESRTTPKGSFLPKILNQKKSSLL